MSYIEVTSGGLSWNMHKILKDNIDIMKIQNRQDWDFKALISGDGMTRTGKTTLASQIAQYWDPTFADNWRERMVVDGQQLSTIARKIGKYKAIVYDEAREGLDSKKQMEKFTRNLLDFFSQCGSLNQLVIIVLPEFFDLPKTIAMTQSIFLINCFARDGFTRGYFDFYNRKDKRYLYIKGKMFLDYTSQRPSFKGTFSPYFPFNKKIYETWKQKELSKLKLRNQHKPSSIRLDTYKIRIKALINGLLDSNWKKYQIAELMKVQPPQISQFLKFEPENPRNLKLKY